MSSKHPLQNGSNGWVCPWLHDVHGIPRPFFGESLLGFWSPPPAPAPSPAVAPAVPAVRRVAAALGRGDAHELPRHLPGVVCLGEVPVLPALPARGMT